MDMPSGVSELPFKYAATFLSCHGSLSLCLILRSEWGLILIVIPQRGVWGAPRSKGNCWQLLAPMASGDL